MRTGYRLLSLLCGAQFLITGCSPGTAGIVDLFFESPVPTPILATAADSSVGARLFLSYSRPIQRERTGFYESSATSQGPWVVESTEVNGAYQYSVYRPPEGGARENLNPNTLWTLPKFQAGIYLESPLLDDFRLGVGAQAVSYANKTLWLVDLRLVTDIPSEHPYFRSTAAVFLGQTETRARYFQAAFDFQNASTGPAEVFFADISKRTKGVQFEFLFGTSAREPALTPFLAGSFTAQHILSYTIPRAFNRPSVDASELLSHWSVVPGLRYQAGESSNLYLGARILWDVSFDAKNTSNIVLPFLQWEFRL